MESIYKLFFAAFLIVIAVGVGLEISKTIDEFVIYVLFWMLYIITLITFINIGLVGNYYITMKDKTGQPGLQGKQGDRGDKGDVGKCDPKCRDSICETNLTNFVIDELKSKNKGVAVKMNNIYKRVSQSRLWSLDAQPFCFCKNQ